MLVINRVRVLGCGPHAHTQFFWENSPHPGNPRCNTFKGIFLATGILRSSAWGGVGIADGGYW